MCLVGNVSIHNVKLFCELICYVCVGKLTQATRSTSSHFAYFPNKCICQSQVQIVFYKNVFSDQMHFISCGPFRGAATKHNLAKHNHCKLKASVSNLHHFLSKGGGLKPYRQGYQVQSAILREVVPKKSN